MFCVRKKFKLCERKIKLQFCNLDHLGLGILANSTNLVNFGSFWLTGFSLFWLTLVHLVNLGSFG